MWINKDALNGYDIHIRLYSQFIEEIQEMAKQENKLIAEIKTTNELKARITKIMVFLNWFTTTFRRIKDGMGKLEFLENAVIKATALKQE